LERLIQRLLGITRELTPVAGVGVYQQLKTLYA